MSELTRETLVGIARQFYRGSWLPNPLSLPACGVPSGTHPSGAAPDDESSRLYHFSQPQLTFEPPSAVKPEADTLARVIEEILGYRRFPLALADESLPDLRVGFLNGEGALTLLEALLSDNLAHLP